MLCTCVFILSYWELPELLKQVLESPWIFGLKKFRNPEITKKSLFTDCRAGARGDCCLQNVTLMSLSPTGGVRGASFIHSPLLESKGRVSMDLMHLTDWLPTLYGRAGGDISELAGLDGLDMWPTLSQGKASPRTELVHNIDPVDWSAALRYQQWKLLVNESMYFFFFNDNRTFKGAPLVSVQIDRDT